MQITYNFRDLLTEAGARYPPYRPGEEKIAHGADLFLLPGGAVRMGHTFRDPLCWDANVVASPHPNPTENLHNPDKASMLLVAFPPLVPPPPPRPPTPPITDEHCCKKHHCRLLPRIHGHRICI